MKKFIVLMILIALVFSACDGGDWADQEYTVLSIDMETREVEVETADGLVFSVIVPEEYDLSGIEPGDTIVPSEEMRRQEEEQEQEQETTAANTCQDDAAIQPLVQAIADQAGVEYDAVKALFCEENMGLGEIKLALKFAEQSGLTLEEVLALHDEFGNWGSVSQAVNIAEKTGLTLEEIQAAYAEAGNWGKAKQLLGLTGADKDKPDNENKPDKEDKTPPGQDKDKPDKPDKEDKTPPGQGKKE